MPEELLQDPGAASGGVDQHADSQSAAPGPSGAAGGGGGGEQRKGRKEYKQLAMPTHEQMVQEDVMNNCAVRTVLAGTMGAALGVAFGVFMGTMDTGQAPQQTPAGVGLAGAEAEKQTTRQVLAQMVKTTRARSWSYAKGFGAVGALFSGSECVIEKVRAKHDIYNSLYAGCASGAVLAHSGGPKAMCIGCATFAAFSAVIDKFMDNP